MKKNVIAIKQLRTNGCLDQSDSSRDGENQFDSVYMLKVKLKDLLTDQICSVKEERGAKSDSKVLRLSSWDTGVNPF